MLRSWISVCLKYPAVRIHSGPIHIICSTILVAPSQPRFLPLSSFNIETSSWLTESVNKSSIINIDFASCHLKLWSFESNAEIIKASCHLHVILQLFRNTRKLNCTNYEVFSLKYRFPQIPYQHHPVRITFKSSIVVNQLVNLVLKVSIEPRTDCMKSWPNRILRSNQLDGPSLNPTRRWGNLHKGQHYRTFKFKTLC